MSSSLTFASLWFQQQAPESILPRVLLKTPSHNFSGLHRRSCFCHRRDHASDTPSIWKTNTLRRPLPTPSGTSKWSCSSLLTLLLLAYQFTSPLPFDGPCYYSLIRLIWIAFRSHMAVAELILWTYLDSLSATSPTLYKRSRGCTKFQLKAVQLKPK